MTIENRVRNICDLYYKEMNIAQHRYKYAVDHNINPESAKEYYDQLLGAYGAMCELLSEINADELE